MNAHLIFPALDELQLMVGRRRTSNWGTGSRVRFSHCPASAHPVPEPSSSNPIPGGRGGGGAVPGLEREFLVARVRGSGRVQVLGRGLARRGHA